DNRLEEYLNADDIYHKIEQQSQQVLTSTLGENAPSKSTIEILSKEATHEDELLETLLILEQKLLADQKRKLNHQKPQLQQQWINEIAQIHAKLGL
ncbi:ABC transporter ATP-binding protein, partial [Escherichia coli]